MPPSEQRGARLILHMLHYHDKLVRDVGASALRKTGFLHLSRNSSHPTSLAIIDVSSPVIKRRQATTKKRSHRHDQFYEARGPVESVSFCGMVAEALADDLWRRRRSRLVSFRRSKRKTSTKACSV